VVVPSLALGMDGSVGVGNAFLSLGVALKTEIINFEYRFAYERLANMINGKETVVGCYSSRRVLKSATFAFFFVVDGWLTGHKEWEIKKFKFPKEDVMWPPKGQGATGYCEKAAGIKQQEPPAVPTKFDQACVVGIFPSKSNTGDKQNTYYITAQETKEYFVPAVFLNIAESLNSRGTCHSVIVVDNDSTGQQDGWMIGEDAYTTLPDDLEHDVYSFKVKVEAPSVPGQPRNGDWFASDTCCYAAFVHEAWQSRMPSYYQRHTTGTSVFQTTVDYDYECANKKSSIGESYSVDFYMRNQAGIGSMKFSPACFAGSNYIQAQTWARAGYDTKDVLSWKPMIKREMNTADGLKTSVPVLYNYMNKLFWVLKSGVKRAAGSTSSVNSYAWEMPPNPGAPYASFSSSELLQQAEKTQPLLDKKVSSITLPQPPSKTCTLYLKGKHYGAPRSTKALPICEPSGCYKCEPIPPKKKTAAAGKNTQKPICYRDVKARNCKKGMQGLIDVECRCVKGQEKAARNNAKADETLGKYKCMMCGVQFGGSLSKEGKNCQEWCVADGYQCPKECEPKSVFANAESMRTYFSGVGAAIKTRIDGYKRLVGLSEE
jgi:hypothetical protein